MYYGGKGRGSLTLDRVFYTTHAHFFGTKLDYVADALSAEATALREGLKLTKNSWL